MREFHPLRYLAATLLGVAAPTLSAAAETWLKAQSRDVVVYSQLSARDTTEFAVRYAEFREVLNRIFAPSGQHAPPSRVLLFRRKETFQAYLPQMSQASTNLTAFHLPLEDGELVALGGAVERDESLVQTFEADGMYSIPRLGYFMPIWMAQGAGEVLASMRFRRGQVLIGEEEPRFELPIEREPWVSWPRFFAASSGSAEYTGRGDRTGRGFTGIYQAQAWAVMHAVLVGDGSGDPRARFQGLAPAIHGTGDDAAAVAAALRTTPEGLTAAVRRSEARRATLTNPVDEAAVRAALKVGPAPLAEVHVQLATLLLADDDDLQSQVQLDQAKALAPSSPMVLEALAAQAGRRNERDEEARLDREAIAAGSTNPMAFIISAMRRLDDVRDNGVDIIGGGGPGVSTAIGELQHALTLAPGNGLAYAELARAYVVAPDTTLEQLAVLTPALGDPDRGVRIRLYRGVVESRLGSAATAARDFQAVAADPRATPAEKGQAADRLRRLAPTQPPHIDVLFSTRAWLQFQGYLKDLADRMAANWTAEAKVAETGYHGQIRLPLVLHPDGTVDGFQKPVAPPETSAAVLDSVRSGAQGGSPYRPWTDGMKQALGASQRLTIRLTFP